MGMGSNLNIMVIFIKRLEANYMFQCLKIIGHDAFASIISLLSDDRSYKLPVLKD